jgi:hypothetical protein
LAAKARLFELLVETFVVDLEALLLTDDLLKTDRKPIRVIEAKPSKPCSSPMTS